MESGSDKTVAISRAETRMINLLLLIKVPPLSLPVGKPPAMLS